MELLVLNSIKQKRKMEEEIKALEIGALRCYFYMPTYYSIQRLGWISLFETLLNAV